MISSISIIVEKTYYIEDINKFTTPKPKLMEDKIK